MFGDDARVPLALMLATLSDRRDFGDDWLLERKFDGERCVACKTGLEVRLESRTGRNLTGTYPEVCAAVSAQRARRLLLDGEIVAFDGEQTSFGQLQQRSVRGAFGRSPSSKVPPSSTACSTCSSSTVEDLTGLTAGSNRRASP